MKNLNCNYLNVKDNNQKKLESELKSSNPLNKFYVLCKIKTLFVIMSVLLSGITFLGCNEEEDDDNNSNIVAKPNQFIYGGEALAVDSGFQVFYGHYVEYGVEANNIDLHIFCDDYQIVFELFVPNESNSIVSGEYVKNNNFKPFTFILGGIINNNTEKKYELSECTVTISVSGDEYVIDVDGRFFDGKKFTGNFTGELIWKNGNEANYPGIMSLIFQGESETVGFDEGTQLALGDFGYPGSYFLVNFEGGNFKLSLSFRASDATAASLPAGTYTFTGEAAREIGKAYAVLNVEGTEIASASGTAWVSKNNSNYNIEFEYDTKIPELSIKGRYSGALPVTSSFDYKSVNSEQKIYKSAIIKKIL